MWCADEIDLERGVYIQRICKKVFDGTEVWKAAGTEFNNYVAFNYSNTEKHSHNGAWTTVISNIAPTLTAKEYNDIDKSGVGGYGNAVTFKILKTVFGNNVENNADALDDWLTYLMSQVANGTPVIAQYILATPIETPLTSEQIVAYKTLKTNYPSTTILNDENAFMKVGYRADTKNFIKRMAGSTTRISSVTLAASKWVGTASPYSQVVTIPGVTKNSKVDLNPTVEQLSIFHNKDISFVVGNNNGVITVYCIGQKPTNDYTMQVTITEVAING